ncbi:hypothetical protein LCGC14_1716690 [marine sediment metagenome]|uniref:Uncharacterized protein n=1 Tax=marine sediment metagenome TaxID=412755 RepID=A0A0F9HDW1_9ZZZZ
MQVVLEMDEAWSLMSVITSYVIDHSGVSQDGKSKIRRWRSDRAAGTVEMDNLAVAVNQTLGAYLDEKMTRTVRRRGRYVSSREVTR